MRRAYRKRKRPSHQNESCVDSIAQGCCINGGPRLIFEGFLGRLSKHVLLSYTHLKSTDHLDMEQDHLILIWDFSVSVFELSGTYHDIQNINLTAFIFFAQRSRQ